MSMELYVLFSGPLPPVAQFAEHLTAFDLVLPKESAPETLDRQSGFVPLRLGASETGVEFDVWNDPEEALSILEDLELSVPDPVPQRIVAFRWGDDFSEMVCANFLAAALAPLVGGTIVEPEEGVIVTPEKIAQDARDIRRDYGI